MKRERSPAWPGSQRDVVSTLEGCQQASVRLLGKHAQATGPVEVLVAMPMGDAVKLTVRGLQSGKALNLLRDPSALDWQPVTKVEHYCLRQNSMKHPVELREAPPEYRARRVYD